MKKIWEWIIRQLEWASWACAWCESGATLYMTPQEFFGPILEKQNKAKDRK